METTLSGTVNAHDIREMAAQAAAFGQFQVWFISAEGVDGYDPLAVNAMARELDRLQRDHGLRGLVAVIVQGRVRMGAALVAMIVRMPIKVAKTRAEAIIKMRELLAAPP